MFAYDTLVSTNDAAMARLRAGDPGDFFVAAASQTGGRGRHGRVWASPPGNLYASLALRDPAPVALAPQLGFVAGVALARTLRARLGGDERLRLKWPNDALFDGAKLAGILLESASLTDGRLGCVIGLGVNCASHPAGLAYAATDLREAGAGVVDSEALLVELAANFEIELKRWDKGHGFSAIRLAWLDMAAGLGNRIAVRTPSRELSGIFREIDSTGRLRLDTEAGSMTIEAGDVFLSVPAAERAT